MLDLVMGDVLIGDAAKAANLSVEAYTEREVARRLQPVTDADIQRFYDENKERAQGRTLDQLRQPILDFLQSQRQQQARAKLVDELRTKAGDVRVMLEPPRVEVTLADYGSQPRPGHGAGHHRRILRLPMTVLRESRSDSQEAPRRLRQQGAPRLQGLSAADASERAEGG